MQVPRKLWFIRGREFLKAACHDAAEPASVRVNSDLCRACPRADNAAVHVHRWELGYELHGRDDKLANRHKGSFP
jgi:hypothetical protein